MKRVVLLVAMAGLLGSDEMIKTKPQAVRGFVQATIKGLQYAFDYPDEAIALILKHHPTLDKEIARAELDMA
jgi:NitT/TauT family transport system substrate-binding protein